MPNNENENNKKGFASADQETRERVAREGGKASHGGGRPAEGNSESESEGMDMEEENQ